MGQKTWGKVQKCVFTNLSDNCDTHQILRIINLDLGRLFLKQIPLSPTPLHEPKCQGVSENNLHLKITAVELKEEINLLKVLKYGIKLSHV